jgi:hypothetical protein
MMAQIFRTKYDTNRISLQRVTDKAISSDSKSEMEDERIPTASN